MNNLLISLGSNLKDGKTILENAIKRIFEISEKASFSSIYETEPVGVHKSNNYFNCVGQISSCKDFDELKSIYKDLEKQFGRDSNSKETGLVALDIDIIIWNNDVVRAHDLSMNYVKKGLNELSGKDFKKDLK